MLRFNREYLFTRDFYFLFVCKVGLELRDSRVLETQDVVDVYSDERPRLYNSGVVLKYGLYELLPFFECCTELVVFSYVVWG